jgi:hypothetical protein
MLSSNPAGYSGGQSSGQNYAPNRPAAAPAPVEEQPFNPAEPVIDIDSPAGESGSGGNDSAPEEEEIRVENIPF